MHRSTHGFEYGTGSLERVRFAADHDGERCLRRAFCPAGYRGVEMRKPQFSQRTGLLSRMFRFGARHVDPYCSGAQGRLHFRIRYQSTRRETVGQHGNDELGISHCIGGRRGNSGSIRNKRLCPRARPVPDREFVTSLEQVARHGQSHEAGADQSDFVGSRHLFCLIVVVGPVSGSQSGRAGLRYPKPGGAPARLAGFHRSSAK